MIVVPAGVRVLVATRPVDFRKGMDGLAALAGETLGQDPFSATVLVFRAKRADRITLLFWDGSGLLLVSKRLGWGPCWKGSTGRGSMCRGSCGRRRCNKRNG